MSYLTDQNIWRAVVAYLRSDSVFKAALKGGIHEEFAPEKTAYPLGAWTAVASPIEDDWGSRMIIGAFQFTVFDQSSVGASNLDQSAANLLDGAGLTVDGQTTLICHRVSGYRTADVDEEGKKVYGIGGTYEVWTDQKPT